MQHNLFTILGTVWKSYKTSFLIINYIMSYLITRIKTWRWISTKLANVSAVLVLCFDLCRWFALNLSGPTCIHQENINCFLIKVMYHISTLKNSPKYCLNYETQHLKPDMGQNQVIIQVQVISVVRKVEIKSSKGSSQFNRDLHVKMRSLPKLPKINSWSGPGCYERRGGAQWKIWWSPKPKTLNFCPIL